MTTPITEDQLHQVARDFMDKHKQPSWEPLSLCFRALRIQPDNNGRRIQVAQVVFRAVYHVMAEIRGRHAVAEHNRNVFTIGQNVNCFVHVCFGQAER